MRFTLVYATSQGLVLLTKNPREVEELQPRFPQHPGILSVYQDNNPAKNKSVADILRTIQNLIAADIPITGQLLPLNTWG